MKGIKYLLAIFLVGMLALCGIASASLIDEVEVDDRIIDINGGTVRLDLQRGSEYEVKVTLDSSGITTEMKDVQIEAFIRGYDHDDLIDDVTDTFTVEPNRIYKKTLTLRIPDRIDISDDMREGEYTVQILVTSRDGTLESWKANIDVSTENHLISIKDVILTPENSVVAGRALLASVRLKNTGEKDEDGIKVQVSIPELGVSASDYVDELEAEESTTSEEIYLRVPADAEAGSYKVRVDVTFDDGGEKVSKETMIEVEGSEAAPEKPVSGPETVITVGPESQDVIAGESGVIYPLTITNKGRTSKTYTIGVEGVDEWGTSKISPTNVLIVASGETKAAYISVAANAGTGAGTRMFGVSISSNAEMLKQIPLTAKVLAGLEPAKDLFGFRRGLEIGLVVLVVLLVIIGLIIGFNKLKGNDEEESDEKTYY